MSKRRSFSLKGNKVVISEELDLFPEDKMIGVNKETGEVIRHKDMTSDDIKKELKKEYYGIVLQVKHLKERADEIREILNQIESQGKQSVLKK